MFAIVALFDEKTEKQIMDYWSSLKDAGIDDSMIRIPGNRPHISLGLFQGVERARFMDAYRTFLETTHPIPVQFDSLGVFPTSETIFLSPLPSGDLFQIQDSLYRTLNDFASKGDDHYKKEQWMPHCSIAISLPDHQKMLDVLEHAIPRFQPLSGTIERVALMRVLLDERGIDHIEEVVVSED
jgi:2'-5' RNA ligase